MEKIYVGKYTSTHGLKGEMKILAEYNENVFIVGKNIYFGDNDTPYKILSYRPHQNHAMITVESLDNIDKIIPLKGKSLYMLKESLDNVNIFVDLLGYGVYNRDLYIGKVVDLMHGPKYNMLVVGDNRIIIPYIDEFIINVDKNSEKIKVDYNI